MTVASELARKCTIELLGTMFLCFTISTSVGLSAALTPVAIGSSLMCAIYFGGHISGAHYNPAVSLALLVRGALPPLDFGCYVVAQLCGALVGGGLSHVISTETTVPGHPAISASVNAGEALLAEFILTFALAHVVIHTATTSYAQGKSYYGLAIGFTVMSGAISVGSFSGGCFNPAVALLVLINSDGSSAINYGDLGVYFAGSLLGGLAAGTLFRLTHPHELPRDSSGRAPDKPPYTDFVVEFIGTFLLCFTVACAVAPAQVDTELAALSIGSMLMVNVFAGGPTSGGHYNPAVTFAAYLRLSVFGGCRPATSLPLFKAVGYVAVQLASAFAAAGVAMIVLPGTPAQIGFPIAHNGIDQPWSLSITLVVEAVATFFLAFVVLQVATSTETAGNSHFGLAIGLTVFVMATAVGAISGGAFNPAVGMLALFAPDEPSITAADPTATYESKWVCAFGVYLFGPLIGGGLAACVYRLTNHAEFSNQPADDSASEATPLKTDKV